MFPLLGAVIFAGEPGSMAIVVIVQHEIFRQKWATALQAQDPGLPVSVYPEVTDSGAVDFALAWRPPQGVFNRFPNLKVIASAGAGVDHILKDPDISPEITITRVVDRQLTHDMTSYLIAQVYGYLRNLPGYHDLQRQEKWQPGKYLMERQARIGIMGMGVLGQDAALKLRQLGFPVKGWSRSPKEVAGIEVLAGEARLKEFLQHTDVLICLLPLTAKTRNILNRQTFQALPGGAFVINVARGEHLVEEDLLAALESGHLAGACLDVFREEPLPQGHPFWRHPNIIITPHVASITSPESVAPQIVANYHRLQRGEPLQNVVSRQAGY